MASPGRGASHLQVVVDQVNRSSRNGAKLVSDAPPRYRAFTRPRWLESPFRACSMRRWQSLQGTVVSNSKERRESFWLSLVFLCVYQTTYHQDC